MWSPGGRPGGTLRPIRPDPAAASVTPVGKLLRILILAAVLAGLGVVVRRLLAERAPAHGLNGSGPRLGSFDTWPPVLKKTESSQPAG